MTAEHQRVLQLVLLVLAVTTIGGLVWWSEIRQAAPDDGREVLTLPSAECNPRGIFCLTRGKGLSISLELDKDATYLSPFGIRVKLFGFTQEHLQQVRIRFTMRDMYMGENQVDLISASPDSSEWRGSAVLPVCLTGRRDWVATVIVEGEERVVSADFPFTIDASQV